MMRAGLALVFLMACSGDGFAGEAGTMMRYEMLPAVVVVPPRFVAPPVPLDEPPKGGTPGPVCTSAGASFAASFVVATSPGASIGVVASVDAS